MTRDGRYWSSGPVLTPVALSGRPQGEVREDSNSAPTVCDSGVA